MSILSALFGSKKRAKKPSPTSPRSTTPPPATSKPKVRASSPTDRAGGPSRFLSLRRRSSAAAYETVQRRSSGDASRKKQTITAGNSPGDQWKLPDLGFEDGGHGGKDVRSGLGLDNVGRVPTLTKEERDKLEEIRFGIEQVARLWKLLGSVLRDTDIPGSILETLPAELEEQDYALRALSVVAVRHESLSDFPSISSHYPTPTSSDGLSLWSDRLVDLARSTSPHAVASALKWVLRRLASIPEEPSPFPLLSSAEYIKFVQAEHAASYPAAAYQTLLAPFLSPAIRQALHEVFDVWAGLTSRAEDQSGLGGRLSLLMGWWILHPESAAGTTWEDMYPAWRFAARRVEHLFLAWIRHQSTTHTLPTRLLALVEKYPFGHSEYSAEVLPSPPPSSFTRRTLHLSLHTDQPLSKAIFSPSDILQAALSSTPIEGADNVIWEAIYPGSGPSGSDASSAEALIDSESSAFLARCSGEPASQPITTRFASPSRQGSFFEGRGDPVPLARIPSNAKLLDTLAEEVGKLAESHTTPFIPSRKASLSRPLMHESLSTWDDFTKSGFAEDKDASLHLALSPSASITTFASAAGDPAVTRTNGWTVVATPTASPSRKTAFAPTKKYTIASEEVIELDDMFIAFTEDGQLDRASSAKWPIYTLLRLKTPYTSQTDTNDGPIERLLITIEYRAPPTPPPATPTANEFTPPRSSSPGGESNFRFGSFGFKKSGSRPGFRSSIFGSNRTLSKEDKGADFITERDTIYKNGAARSAIFGGSVEELGQLSKAPGSSTATDSVEKKARKAVPSLLAAPRSPSKLEAPLAPILFEETQTEPEATAQPVDSLPVPVAAKAIKVDESVSPPETIAPTGLSTETTPGEWSYGAEGGAHVVFIFTSTSGPYAGKLLRIRKISTHRGDPLEASSGIWRDDLLQQLVPPRLLVQADGVKVDEKWLKELLAAAEEGRAEERKAKGSLLEEVGSDPRVSIMENLRVVEGRSAGTRVLSVEIKPKWGFLPSAQSINPPEAAAIKSKVGRYTLHQNYRGIPTGSDGYDPLDLFSGDEARIKRALVGLWGIWRETGGQANSFRVFVDGNIVHPDEADTEGSLLRVTAPILIPLLQSSNVLPVLRDLQASLDPTDISDLVSRFQSAHPDIPLFDESVVSDIQPEELLAFIARYLATPGGSAMQDTEWSLRERIIAYSLSAIFKDCSIIIRAVLSPSPEEGKWVVEGQGSTVKMLDLDLKPLKMRHWAELDEKIWRRWAETKRVERAEKEDPVANTATPPELPVATPALDTSREMMSRENDASTSLLQTNGGHIPTPGIGSGLIVPGGFPGNPDVPISTPGAEVGPGSAVAEQSLLTDTAPEAGPDNEELYSWHLQWYNGLETASTRYFAERDVQGMLDVLMPLHELVGQVPEAPIESSFVTKYGSDLAKARIQLREGVDSSESDLPLAWDLYYAVFQRLQRELKTLGLIAPSPVVPHRDHLNVSSSPAAHISAASSIPQESLTIDGSHNPPIASIGTPSSAQPDAGVVLAENEAPPPNGAKENGVASADREQDAGEGTTSAYSSAFSTPMVPGAFNFPDMSSSAGTPLKQASSDIEVLTDRLETTDISDTAPAQSDVLAASSQSPVLNFSSPRIPIDPLATGLLASPPLESDTSSIGSAPNSPVGSRFERSFAPSPSPAPTSDHLHPGIPLAEADMTLSSIALNSPTFGVDDHIDTASIRSGSSVTAETIESGSSITEESSHSPSRQMIIDLAEPSTPEWRRSDTPLAPIPPLADDVSGTPTQRTFPHLGPIALGLPVITPKSSASQMREAYVERGRSSPTGSAHSVTPSRPERRRVDSLPRTQSPNVVSASPRKD